MSQNSNDIQQKTIVIVQSRLGSTRLPEKGLLPLGGKPVIDHVLSTMHQVPAARYYLATDESSYGRLQPEAEKYGFEAFAGSADDVLGRFCAVIRKFHADMGYFPEIIVRATGDNPFLFGTAACASVDQYYSDAETSGCLPAYFTLTGLPHGSGIEVLHAESLLKAQTLTDEPYDHEHVGPALYRHQDIFACVFKPSPACWKYPELRTTIDTAGDYQRAKRLYAWLNEKYGTSGPFEDQYIAAAFEEPHIAKPVLFIPSVTQDHGTGHFRRCVQLAKELHADIYVGDAPLPLEFQNVLSETPLEEWQLLKKLPDKDQLQHEPGYLYALVVLDQFITGSELADAATLLGPVCSIDEGAEDTGFAQYLLDVIPSVEDTRLVNGSFPQCIPLPINRKTQPSTELKKVLVCIGGQDPAGLTASAVSAAKSCGLVVTAVTKDTPVPNLKESMADYDLVITHYGFTAFEAVAAGCAVLLTGTTLLHEKLAEKYGFACISKDSLLNTDKAVKVLKSLVSTPEKLYNRNFLNLLGETSEPLSAVVRELSRGVSRHCPVCGKTHQHTADSVVFRGPDRTFRRCSECGIVYLSWCQKKESDYQADYFFEDYKKQYGRTYLEDFEFIKSQGVERASQIKEILDQAPEPVKNPRLLDVGCAFGPFLAAASQLGFTAEGTDINQEAVDYVCTTLGFPAFCAAFPKIDIPEKAAKVYDAVTMWYVIEHMPDLDAVLRTVSSLLKNGGIFAFSTPDLNGVTGTYNIQKFFMQSPTDHLSLWESRNCATVLSKYGFEIQKVISTGHHPERFPGCEQIKPGSFRYRWLMRRSKKHNLGDTCQVFCKKTGEV